MSQRFKTDKAKFLISCRPHSCVDELRRREAVWAVGESETLDGLGNVVDPVHWSIRMVPSSTLGLKFPYRDLKVVQDLPIQDPSESATIHTNKFQDKLLVYLGLTSMDALDETSGFLGVSTKTANA